MSFGCPQERDVWTSGSGRESAQITKNASVFILSSINNVILAEGKKIKFCTEKKIYQGNHFLRMVIIVSMPMLLCFDSMLAMRLFFDTNPVCKKTELEEKLQL